MILEQWFSNNVFEQCFRTMIFEQWCSNNDFRTMMFEQWCPNNDVRTMIFEQWCSNNDVRTMMFEQWCSNNDVRTMMFEQRFSNKTSGQASLVDRNDFWHLFDRKFDFIEICGWIRKRENVHPTRIRGQSYNHELLHQRCKRFTTQLVMHSSARF
jgi:hypothetical protein